jgi:hypothetical protein
MGVILSAAVLQAERRISREHRQRVREAPREIPHPAEVAGFRDDAF